MTLAMPAELPAAEIRPRYAHALAMPAEADRPGGLAPAPRLQAMGELHYTTSPLQRRAASRNGISDGENAAVERLSGGRVDLHTLGASVQRVAADDARLRAVGARSYAQGSQALVGHDADRGHEIWHLAQQAMGRVRADTEIAGQAVNTDTSLEREADHMGAAITRQAGAIPGGATLTTGAAAGAGPTANAPIQGVFGDEPKPDPWARRKAQFKRGIDGTEARRRRQEVAETLRSQKRQDKLDKLRYRKPSATQTSSPPPLFSGFSSPSVVTSGFGSSGFGSSGFGTSGFGSSGFGSSGFGSSVFGSSAFSASAFGASPFGPSSFGPSSFGTSSFGTSTFDPASFGPYRSSDTASSTSTVTPLSLPPIAADSTEEEQASQDDAAIDDLIAGFANLALSFRDKDGGQHRVYLDPATGSVIVHSNPTPLDTIITQKKWENIAINAATITKLKTAQTKITAELVSYGSNRSKTSGEKLRKAMVAATQILKKISNIPIPAVDLSGSDNYNSNANPTEGSKVVAEPLSLNGVKPGTGPQKKSRLMKAIQANAPPSQRTSYYRMHLLNDNVFGPGELWNLTPGPSQSNSTMEHGVETDLKKAIIDEGVVMSFEASVDYKSDPMAATTTELNNKPDLYRFKSIDFTATQWAADAATTSYLPDVNTNQTVIDIDGASVKWDWGSLTPLQAKPQILSTADAQELIDVGIPSATANRIVDFTQNGPGLVLAGRKDKRTQLVDAIKAWDGKRAISKKWDANAVLWK